MRRIKLLFIFFTISMSALSNKPTQLDSVFIEVLSMKLEHPTIVISQVILESNHMRSELFVQNNNMFGMKQSGQRATTSTVIVGGYKYYEDWRESLIDYALLQMAYYKGLSREEYFAKLSRVYASADKYTETLRKVEKNLPRYLTKHSLTF